MLFFFLKYSGTGYHTKENYGQQINPYVFIYIHVSKNYISSLKLKIYKNTVIFRFI